MCRRCTAKEPAIVSRPERDKFYGDPTAKLAISQELDYAIIWILFNRNKDPVKPAISTMGYHRDYATERELELKRFYADKFHPEGTPAQVANFTWQELRLRKSFNDTFDK